MGVFGVIPRRVVRWTAPVRCHANGVTRLLFVHFHSSTLLAFALLSLSHKTSELTSEDHLKVQHVKFTHPLGTSAQLSQSSRPASEAPPYHSFHPDSMETYHNKSRMGWSDV